ncbi:CwfJ C-terminus 1-domain-containing protein-like protein [Haematococcus lacustris]
MATVKVILCGAVEGGVEGLYKKVGLANKKVGADLLLCVGQFFASGPVDAEPADELVSLVTGDSPVPLPTFFIGGAGGGSAGLLEALPASDCKLKYLGKAGVAQVHGLTVAFLDGVYNAAAFHSELPDPPHTLPPPSSSSSSRPPSPYYTARDVDRLRRQLEQLDGEVDLLLTCEWPKGVAQGVPPSLMPASLAEGGTAAQASQGSQVVADLAVLARPRYHITGGVDCHFARLPYVNKDLGAGPRATRFIALAPLNSPAKHKSLHALALVPSQHQSPEVLAAVPEGATPCPYMPPPSAAGVKREPQLDEEGGLGVQDWRWSSQQRGSKRGRGGSGPDHWGGRGPRGGGGGGGGEGDREPPAVIQGRVDVVRDPYCTITARNVPFKASEADIVRFFAQAGKVVDVVRGANSEGKVNSWLTVQFDSKEAAEKALQLHNTDFMGRQITVDPATAGSNTPAAALGVPVEGCWFCLGSSSVDLSLVASVGDDAYLALDKGAITDHHVLIVPVDHYPSTASLPPAAFMEVERYLSALRTCFASFGRELVAFERHLALRKSGGNHCHVNVIAVSRDAAKRAKQAFQSATQSAGFSLSELPAAAGSSGSADGGVGGGNSNQAALQTAVGSAEYFYAWLPDGTRLVRPIMRGERWPMNLGREVLAELAGEAKRADWKACAVSAEEEAARTERFKTGFKPYDFTQSQAGS